MSPRNLKGDEYLHRLLIDLRAKEQWRQYEESLMAGPKDLKLRSAMTIVGLIDEIRIKHRKHLEDLQELLGSSFEKFVDSRYDRLSRLHIPEHVRYMESVRINIDV